MLWALVSPLVKLEILSLTLLNQLPLQGWQNRKQVQLMLCWLQGLVPGSGRKRNVCISGSGGWADSYPRRMMHNPLQPLAPCWVQDSAWGWHSAGQTLLQTEATWSTAQTPTQITMTEELWPKQIWETGRSEFIFCLSICFKISGESLLPLQWKPVFKFSLTSITEQQSSGTSKVSFMVLILLISIIRSFQQGSHPLIC